MLVEDFVIAFEDPFETIAENKKILESIPSSCYFKIESEN
jgi:hypothetical protein